MPLFEQRTHFGAKKDIALLEIAAQTCRLALFLSHTNCWAYAVVLACGQYTFFPLPQLFQTLSYATAFIAFSDKCDKNTRFCVSPTFTYAKFVCPRIFYYRKMQLMHARV